MIVISDRRCRGDSFVTKGSWVRAEWEPNELVDVWTLVEGDWEMAGAKLAGQPVRFSWSDQTNR